MELKPVICSLIHLSSIVLIVPYGIETIVSLAMLLLLILVLIVPYGIETYFMMNGGSAGTVLIVPYGIETW